jgi:hypothetical protein
MLCWVGRTCPDLDPGPICRLCNVHIQTAHLQGQRSRPAASDCASRIAYHALSLRDHYPLIDHHILHVAETAYPKWNAVTQVIAPGGDGANQEDPTGAHPRLEEWRVMHANPSECGPAARPSNPVLACGGVSRHACRPHTWGTSSHNFVTQSLQPRLGYGASCMHVCCHGLEQFEALLSLRMKLSTIQTAPEPTPTERPTT